VSGVGSRADSIPRRDPAVLTLRDVWRSSAGCVQLKGLGGGLRDGVLAFAVLAGLVVHLARQLDLTWSELRLLAAGATAGASGHEAVAHSFGHERVLELCDCPEYVEEHPPHGGGGVDSLVEHDQVHAALLKHVRKLDQVLERAAEPVELGDD
jgi:hypothetical protein